MMVEPNSPIERCKSEQRAGHNRPAQARQHDEAERLPARGADGGRRVLIIGVEVIERRLNHSERQRGTSQKYWPE